MGLYPHLHCLGSYGQAQELQTLQDFGPSNIVLSIFPAQRAPLPPAHDPSTIPCSCTTTPARPVPSEHSGAGRSRHTTFKCSQVLLTA